MPGLIQTYTGKTSDQLGREGARRYPNEDVGHNHPGHRLGANIMTGRYGPTLASLGGYGMEAIEFLANPALPWTKKWNDFMAEAGSDIAANQRGIQDAKEVGTPSFRQGLSNLARDTYRGLRRRPPNPAVQRSGAPRPAGPGGNPFGPNTLGAQAPKPRATVDTGVVNVQHNWQGNPGPPGGFGNWEQYAQFLEGRSTGNTTGGR